MKTKSSILFAALVVLTNQSLAETLDDAWATALSSHRQIAAAAAESDAANYELEHAKSLRLPQLGVTTSYTQLNSAPGIAFGNGTASTPIFDDDNFVSGGLQFSIPLYAGGAINSGIDAARSGAQAAVGQLETVMRNIKLGVAEHYVGVLRAESAVVVADSNVATLATHTDDANNRYSLGAVPQNDYLAASVTLANAQQRLLQTRNALDYARAAYNRYLGRPLHTAVSLEPDLDIDRLVPDNNTLEALSAIAQLQRPELTTLDRQAQALRKQSDVARAQARPQLALTGGYMLLENEILDDEEFWVAGISMQWNLFDGGQSRKKSASLNRKALAVGHHRAELQSIVALQVRGAWNDRIEADSRLAVAESAVVQAAENLRVVRNRYNAGASTNVEVLDAQALREQSLSNHDNARYEVVLATLRLARAIGSL